MQPHKIVSREQWIEARKAHLAHEKEFTQARDRHVRGWTGSLDKLRNFLA